MTDSKTNFLFLADTLPIRFPSFYPTFLTSLRDTGVRTGVLPGTKDIWAKDYMPVQTGPETFIQFNYDPDYLKPKRWHHLRTDPIPVTEAIEMPSQKVDLTLDGGNVIQGNDYVIMTDKIFSENQDRESRSIIGELEGIFGKRLVIIPGDPSDYTGHADGMLRFYDDKTVLINRYQYEDKAFSRRLMSVLKEASLDCIEIPYSPYENESLHDATGLYINFLQLTDIIFLPIFDIPEDSNAMDEFTKLFPRNKIIPVNSREIAKDGGVLNCISWNIFVP